MVLLTYLICYMGSPIRWFTFKLVVLVSDYNQDQIIENKLEQVIAVLLQQMIVSVQGVYS